MQIMENVTWRIKMPSCSSCKQIKEPSAFFVTRTRKTGLSFYCKECTKIKKQSPGYKAVALAYSRSDKRKASVKQYHESEGYKAKVTSGYFAAAQRKNARNIKERYNYASNVASRRKLEFNLSLDQYQSLILQHCYYCETVTFGKESGGGLDRINNDKGYTFDNVLPCCGDCNKHRHTTWTVDEAKIAIEAVLKLRQENQILCLAK
jgi:hypothetical protein